MAKRDLIHGQKRPPLPTRPTLVIPLSSVLAFSCSSQTGCLIIDSKHSSSFSSRTGVVIILIITIILQNTPLPARLRLVSYNSIINSKHSSSCLPQSGLVIIVISIPSTALPALLSLASRLASLCSSSYLATGRKSVGSRCDTRTASYDLVLGPCQQYGCRPTHENFIIRCATAYSKSAKTAYGYKCFQSAGLALAVLKYTH